MNKVLRFPRGLYGITPEWDDTARLADAITAAAKGGMTALQWRRKTAAGAERVRQAAALAALCRSLGVVFIVNDDIELALEVNADGVHLGRDDGSLQHARQRLGPSKIIGSSCYNEPELARRALTHDVDYVAFGAVYPSSVKPDAVAATLDVVRAGRVLTDQFLVNQRRPAVVAIGGITPDNAAPVIEAGADSVALISGLFGADDIGMAAQRCTALFLERPD